MEIWRDIPGWESCYQVSDSGRVRSCDRVVSIRNPHGVVAPRNYKGRILRKGKLKNGYERVSLTAPGRKRACFYVHDLVLLAFEGPKPPGLEVRHGDGVRHHNERGNLCYGTRSQNAMDRHAHGTMNPPRGEAASAAKLTDDAVRWIRRHKHDFSQRQMGERFGVSHNVIGYVQRGETWRHVQ